MRKLIAMLVLSAVASAFAPRATNADEPTPDAIINRALTAGNGVRVTKPAETTIVRAVEQSCLVEPFERAQIYPKMAAFIEEWYVDIGDRVKKGDRLATLQAPELMEEWETKKTLLKLEQVKVEYAQKVVKVSEAEVLAANAKLNETKALLDQSEASVARWETQFKRLKKEVDAGVLDTAVLAETERQWRSSLAERNAARAAIAKAEADLQSRKAAKLRDDAAVLIAAAGVDVAQNEAKRLEALAGYLTLRAPFDGVITTRYSNRGDLVSPPSADAKSSPPPLYTVERIDKVRFFVDVPIDLAEYVQKGTKASVLIKGVSDRMISASVSRTALVLHPASQTLRVEIVIPNDDRKYLPGMDAEARILIERPDVLALPLRAVFSSGDATFCWTIDNRGAAQKMELRTGVSNDQWIEVSNWRRAEVWKAIKGTDQVLLVDDPSTLTDGEPVTIAKDAPPRVSPKSFGFVTEATLPGGEKINVRATIAGPSLFVLTLENNNIGSNVLVGGGDTFWLKSSRSPLDGKGFAEYYAGKNKETFDALRCLFYGVGLPDRLAALKGKTYKLAVLGAQPVDGTDAVVVRASHELYPEALLYFDKATGRLVKSQFKIPAGHKLFFGSSKSTSLEIFYGNYKEVNGVWHFTSLKLRTDETLEIELRDLGFSERFDARTFKKPA